MRKIIFGTAIALSLAAPGAASAQKVGGANIILVDTDRIYRECTACVAAQGQLQTQVDQARQRAQQLSQPLQTEGQSIEAAVRALNGKQPDAALQARANALQAKQQTANQELAGREQTLRSTQAHVSQQINQRLNPIINQVMSSRGANVAVDVGATLAHAQALDVTNDVLALLNQQLPSVSVTPLPQQTQQQPAGR